MKTVVIKLEHKYYVLPLLHWYYRKDSQYCGSVLLGNFDNKREANKLYKELTTQQGEWIDKRDRTPKNNKLVQIKFHEIGSNINRFEDDRYSIKHGIFEIEQSVTVEVTHWRELNRP